VPPNLLPSLAGAAWPWAFTRAGLRRIFASRQLTPERWLSIWLIEVFVAVAIAAPASATKAHRANAKLLSGPGRKFLFEFRAARGWSGGLLTFAMGARRAWHALLPGMWLLLYGAAIVTAGSFFRALRSDHGAMLDASLAQRRCLFPAIWADLFMAFGFGFVQIGFGIWIALRYGG